MLDRNVQELLARLSESDLVLDVGGWACPFNRAQWILDAQPYETRGFYRTFGGPPFQGPEEEWFSPERWVQRDICDREPWPFRDKQFEFAVCSHTLEDLRDPLWVCSELARVAKAGYVEVPSRRFESCLGIERPGQAGLSHHRWLIEIDGSHIRFLQKYHMIHADWRLALPSSYRRSLSPESAVTWLWWEGSFTAEEREIHGIGAQEAELRAFVDRIMPPPSWLVALDSVWRQSRSLSRRALSKARRLLRTGTA